MLGRRLRPILRLSRQFSQLTKNVSSNLTSRQGSQFSKAGLTDWGELPRGQIPSELEFFPANKLQVLPNGARIFSEEYAVDYTLVSVYVKAGSRYETLESSGATHLLWKLVFKGQGTTEAEVAALGGKVSLTADREFLGFHIKARPSEAPKALDFLCKHVLAPKISAGALEAEKPVAFRHCLEVSQDQYAQSIEFLFAALFNDHMMGQPLHGNRDNLVSLSQKHIEEHVARTYCGPNAQVIFSGNVEAQAELRSVAEAHLSRLPAQTQAATPNLDKPLRTAISSNFRDDEMHNINVAVGYAGPSGESPELFKYKFFEEIIGEYNAAHDGTAHNNTPSTNYNTLHQYLGSGPGIYLANARLMSFSDVSVFAGYVHSNDLYGSSVVSVIPFVLAQHSMNLDDVEIFRARAKIFNKLLTRTSTTQTHDEIARELDSSSRRVDRSEAARRFSALACGNVLRAFAKQNFHDYDIAVSTWGLMNHMMDLAYYEEFVNRATRGKFRSLWV